jgi:hypothetical protein
MPRSRLKSASSVSSCRRIFAASSGAIDRLSPRGIATSNRASCRRVRSMKARPSSYVIVLVVSANEITLAAGKMDSHQLGFRKCVASSILPNPIASAKQISSPAVLPSGLIGTIPIHMIWNGFNVGDPKHGHPHFDRTLLRAERSRRAAGGVPNLWLGETYAP